MNSIFLVPSTKKSKSNRRKEISTTNSSLSSKTTLTPGLIFPPKPPASKTSKLQADFRSLTIPSLTKTEIPTCPSLLSAKIQSVSFTAGTFGSITTDESSRLSSTNPTRLNINLSRKSSLLSTNQLLRQAASPNEISALLSSLESSKPSDELPKSSCDFCCCDLFSDSNPCLTCMSLPNSTTITCAFNQRDAEVKERLKLKLTKRTVQNQSKSSIGNKSKTKPYDNNIDDLVRFIDGNETPSDGSTTKKKKKKKDKQIPINEDTQEKKPLSKRKQKAKLKLEQQEKPEDESPIIRTSTPPPPLLLPEKIQTIIESSSEKSPPPDEEVNWITISRKQSKHKPNSYSIVTFCTY